jgi:caa(3)-type oxidase subunit IV
MTETHEHHDAHDAGHVNYKKIYFTLVVLLVISVAGPFVGIKAVTLITAFGIALVKANLVIQNFMHLKWEKRIMKWMLTTSLILMALFLAGVSGDVLNHNGDNWENLAAQAAVERGLHPAAEEAPAVIEAAEFSAESTFNLICAQCHGRAGDGTGPAGAALDPHPANFTDPEFWTTRDMDRIRNVITNGAASVGGSPLMVSWSASFSADQIAQLADYVAHFRPN